MSFSIPFHVSSRSCVFISAFEDGVSAVLVTALGTIPIQYRQNVYNIPISMYVPYNYPAQAPIVLVTPTQGMIISPGVNVDPNGRVTHSMVQHWHQSPVAFLEFGQLYCSLKV
jgi:ESCRT-I complex subunit TSG101